MAIAFLIIPYVVTSVSPVVDYGPKLLAIETTYKSQVATLQEIDLGTRAALHANEHDTAAIAKALTEVEAKSHVSAQAAVAKLLAARKIPTADRNYLFAHGQQVLNARAQAPRQWEHWWWVCVGGQVVFLPTSLLLTGRWRRKAAKQDREDHQREIDAELAQLADAGRELSGAVT